jgi:aldose 1-epimerase
VIKKDFGALPEGTEIELYEFKLPAIEASFMSYGASVVTLRTKDKSGQWDDIVLGFADLAGYVRNHRSKAPVYFGSSIGRYGNRIAGARFSLAGRQYNLTKNNGENSLHGGPGGFHNVVWKPKPETNGVAFHYFSKDGEEGFPGNLAVTVRYTLANAELRIDYQARTDQATVLSLTNHSYFNLSGAGRGPYFRIT